MKPPKNNIGLYSPEFEKDSCGIGFIAHVRNKPSHKIVTEGLSMLRKMEHRGGVAADGETGDGAGILIQMPHDFLLHLSHDDKQCQSSFVAEVHSESHSMFFHHHQFCIQLKIDPKRL